MVQPKTNGILRTSVVLLLCAIFFLLAMGTALLSSSLYSGTVRAANENAAQRTALSYLMNQIRRSDVLGGIRIEDNALLLRTAQDDTYVTKLYCYEGNLMELYTEESLLSSFEPADGERILPLDTLTITRENGVLRLDAAGDTVSIAPRAGFEEVAAS